MVHHVYSVSPHDGGWAVDHIGKVLEVYGTRQEAEAAVDRLAKLTQASGHDAEVILQGADCEVEADMIYRRVER